ncbi:MAG: hypothetical protein PF487_04325 [Bacteroidales bacterium]|jgi:hypothetical protein|nr:hypothetical protein [Bacteroidales bacterium]
MQNKSWQISLKELSENVKGNIAEIKKNAAYIFYPLFLLYAFTCIGLAKLIQIIFY